MEFDYLYGNEGKATPQYSYFKVANASGAISNAFGDMDAAIKYAINSDSYINWLKEVTLFKTEDGRICKDEAFLYYVPNINYRCVSYIVIGKDVDDVEPNFMGFYPYCEDINNVELFKKYVKERYDIEDNPKIGLYSVLVSITDDNNSINVEYNLIQTLKNERTKN